MAYVKLSNELIKEYPEAIQAMREYFKGVEEVESESTTYRKFEVYGHDVPQDDLQVYITFGWFDDILKVFNVEKT